MNNEAHYHTSPFQQSLRNNRNRFRICISKQFKGPLFQCFYERPILTQPWLSVTLKIFKVDVQAPGIDIGRPKLMKREQHRAAAALFTNQDG